MAAGWSLIEEKRALRRAIRARREALSLDERARAAGAVSARLSALPEFQSARVVSGYLPTRGELDPGAALAAAAGRGATIVYPRVTAERPRLRFHPVASPELLRVGAFGILEPPADSAEVAIDRIDCVLVPGLAFDAQGRRLGYGGGYYDEAGALLRAAGRAFLVGVAFEFQMIDCCPTGDGDVVLDCVVTEDRVVRCDGQR